MTNMMKSVQNLGYESYLIEDYQAGTDTTITVFDASSLPEAPNSVCISSLNNEDSVIVKYSAVSGNVLTIDTITHYNRPGAETFKYTRGCNVYKEFSDTISGGGGGSGTSDYNALSNKPKINGTTLQGDKSLDDIGAAKKSGWTANKYIGTDASGNLVEKEGGSGTSDYTALSNKPQINSVELNGNKTLDDIGAAKKSGWTANKYIGTDASGNLVEKDGSSASVSFAQITGDPTDNDNLKAALASKINKASSTVKDFSIGIDASDNIYLEY